jgi:virulence-associated protein VagC
MYWPMNANPKSLPTRVFRAGNSQAVRIPKAFELPEGEVVIERRAGGLLVKPKRGGWQDFFAKPSLDLDLDPAALRATGPERAVDFDLTPKQRKRRTARK